MPRSYLIKAREERDLSQRELAELLGGVSQATICRWETGTETPQPYQRRRIRDILKKDVDSYPHLFDLDNQWSSRGIRDIMEMLRRQFIEALAKIGGLSLFGNVSLALVSSPVVAPEEYLAQSRITIDACWQWLNSGNYGMVEQALRAHEPTLTRFANTISPFQGVAASLAVQAKMIQMYLATRKLDHVTREILCGEAVHFGKLASNSRMYTMALEWQGYTYTTCSHQPQRAIAIFTDALASVDSEAWLSKANISIGLALAYAQDSDEIKARDYAEQARVILPQHPELDPFYPHIGLGHSELDQFEGKMYLYLAEHFPQGGYSQLAYDAFEKSTTKQAMNRGYRSGSLIKKADAARGLDEMPYFVESLTQGLAIAVEIDSLRRISEAHDVLHRIPEAWQKETAIQALQKVLTQAIVVVHR